MEDRQCGGCETLGGCPGDCGERLNLTEFDFLVRDEGTILILYPENDAARAWIEEFLYTPDGGKPGWWGGGVVLDQRPGNEIVRALVAEGYDVGAAA